MSTIVIQRIVVLVMMIQVSTVIWMDERLLVGAATTVPSGETYPMCFMNITGGGDFIDYGFVQIYGFSVNATRIRVAALTRNVDEFRTVGMALGTTFNYTRDFSDVSFESVDHFTGNEATGIIPSASEKMTFVGVKSDKGSTDAFLALPLFKSSKEFFVAAWPYQPPFDASCAIIPALNRTCVEVYKFFPNGSAIMLASTSLNQYDTYRYFANYTVNLDGSRNPSSYEDMTGYYINSTKPVQVLCGHECAWVPANSVPFCDHMIEQIPPVAQLGTNFIVPPMNGRSPNAGYVVRVVATKTFTTVTWKSATLGAGSVILPLAGFKEILTTKTMEPLQVTCSEPCLVMQYSKGRRAATNDVPTDPFMMLVVPSDHFTGEAGFATPNYCDEAKLRIVFDNWVTIVTSTADKDKILFDGKNLSLTTSNQWDTGSISGYAIVTFRVTHNFHYAAVTPSGSASFACYVYGHSLDDRSASAYGFSANYKMNGEAVTDVWEESIGAFDDYTHSRKNETCASKGRYSGENVLNDTYVPFPFTLSASFDPVSMSQDCFQFYNESFWMQLTNFTRKINYWICTTQLCSYLQGEGVAINYATLAAQFVTNSQGRYNGVTVTVEVAASLDTSSVYFATCRVEIRNYMLNFINWPSSSRDLFPIPAIRDCTAGPLKFAKDSFVVNTQTCPSI